MQPLKYARATSVEEAVRLLQDGGEHARVLAGGTDVIVQARERRRVIDLFVDVKHIPDVMELTYDSSSGLTVGAGVPFYRIYGDAAVQEHYPALVDSTHVVGGTAIQGRATLGGNLANASPAADTVPAMVVLSGIARIAGPNGFREVAVEQFCTGPGQSVLEPGEFIVSLHFPQPAPGSGQAWQRFIPRNEMDIAVTNAGVYLEFDGETVSNARIAVGAVAPTVLLVEDAANALVGQPLSDETIAAAGRAAKDAARPIDDMRGSIKQRKHLAGVLTERMIRKAAERARG